MVEASSLDGQPAVLVDGGETFGIHAWAIDAGDSHTLRRWLTEIVSEGTLQICNAVDTAWRHSN